MKLIRLKLAEPRPSDDASASRSLKQWAAWLEELPRGNADQTADALHEALLVANRSVLRKTGRYELMELLRPAVNDTCAMLVGRYKGQSLPLPEEQQAHAERVLKLYRELASGLRLAVNEQIDDFEHRREGAALRLQLAIQRSLLSLGRSLLESYRIYALEPPLLWRDAHTLYRNAEIAKLQALPIEGVRDAEETALSIKQAYLRVAVLSLTNPYHLMQGEAEELYKRIGRWVHFVQLRAPDVGEDMAGQFAIDLSSDFPARYLPKSVSHPPAAAPRILVVERLVQTLSEQIARSNELLASSRSSSTLSERMQRDMYVRFRDALAGRPERQSERKPTVARLVLVEGLSACHFFLNGRRPFTPEEDESEWNERLGGTGKDKLGLKLLEDDELDRSKPQSLGRVSQFKGHDADADDIWRKANLVTGKTDGRAVRRSRYKVTSWHRKNESEGGMALFCAQECPIQVRVGELLAHSERDSADPAQWRLGTIRWLRTRPNGGLELGVKSLSTSGMAVGTKAVSGAGKGSEYLRGILIPRVNPLTHEATLLAPAAVYDVGSVLRLNLQQVVLYARLTELLETTRLFAHFRIKLVDAPADLAEEAKAAKRGDTKRFLV